MEWFRKCSHFWYLSSLAADASELMQQNYQNALQHFKKTWRGDELAVVVFIQDWENNPTFNIDDLQFTMRTLVNRKTSYYLHTKRLFEAFGSFPHSIFEPLVDMFTNEFLITGEAFHSLDREDYLDIEKNYSANLVTKKTLDRALYLMIKIILHKINIVILEQEEENHSNFELVTLQRIYNLLLAKSLYFPKTLLDNLMKRLGPELYIKIVKSTNSYDHEEISKNNKIRINDIISKEHIDTGDMALFLKLSVKVPSKHFLDILNRATDDAKEYARGFLYNADEETYHSNLAIISEDFTLMNEHMSPVSWPAHISAYTWNELSEWQQKLWGPILADFKIIPVS